MLMTADTQVRATTVLHASVREAAEAHRAWIAEEVLARELVVGAGPAEGSNHAARDVELDGLHARVAFTRE